MGVCTDTYICEQRHTQICNYVGTDEPDEIDSVFFLTHTIKSFWFKSNYLYGYYMDCHWLLCCSILIPFFTT